jgi:hypothetical protein
VSGFAGVGVDGCDGASLKWCSRFGFPQGQMRQVGGRITENGKCGRAWRFLPLEEKEPGKQSEKQAGKPPEKQREKQDRQNG